MEEKLSRYFAFISYSHADAKLAKWLHRKLEAYRLPNRLSGQLGALGPIPKRLFPIFRDDDELATSHNLGQQINEALIQSRFLIVICSKKSATSKWVNEEIRLFKSLGRDNNILCVIADGSPYASDKSGRKDEECLPAAIRFEYSGETISDKRAPMHFAADFRDKMHARKTLLKLISALVGVDYDTLYARQRKRTRMRVLTSALASVMLIALTAGLLQFQASALQHKIDLANTKNKLSHSLTAITAGNTQQALTELITLDTASFPASINNQRTTALYRALAQHHTSSSLSGSTRPVTLSVYKPQSDQLTLAHDDGEIEIWQSKNNLLEANYKIHSTELTTLNWAGRNRVISAARDGQFRLHDFQLKSTYKLTGHDGLLLSSAYSKSAKIIYAAGTDKRLHSWNSITGEYLGPIITLHNGIEKLRLSPDEKKLLAVTIQGNAFLIDTNTTKITHKLKVDNTLINAVDFSPDSSLLATAHTNNKAYTWNTTNGEQLATLSGHFSWVTDIKFNHTGNQLATASWDNTILLWNTGSDVPVHKFSPHYRPIQNINFSGDDKYLMSLSWDNRLRIWDINKKNLHAVFKINSPHQVRNAIYNYNDTKIISIGKAASLYTVSPLNTVSIFQHTGFKPTLIALNHDNSLLAASDKNGKIIVWSLLTEQILYELDKHSTAITKLAFAKSTNYLFSTTAEGIYRVWDMASGKTLHIDNTHRWGITALAINKADTQFATGGMDRYVYIHDTKTNTLLFEIQFTRDIHQVAYNPANNDILVRNGHLHIWAQDQSDARFRDESRLINYAEYNHKGTHIVTSSANGVIHLLDANTGALLNKFTGHKHAVNRARFSHNDKLIVTASKDGTAIIWDVRSAKPLHVLPVQSGNVRSAFFTRDDKIVITISSDNAIRLWNTVSGEKIAQYEGHEDLIYHARLSDDGSFLVTSSRDTSIRVWKLFELDELTALARQQIENTQP